MVSVALSSSNSHQDDQSTIEAMEAFAPCKLTPLLPGLFEDAVAQTETDFLPLLDFLVPQKQPVPNSAAEAAALWNDMTPELQSFFGDVIWRSWLRHIQPSSVQNGVLSLAVPTTLMRDWIERNYNDKIGSAARRINPAIQALSFVADPDIVLVAIETTVLDPSGANDNQNIDLKLETKIIDPRFNGRLDPRYTFDQFIVDKSNMLAFNAAGRVAGTMIASGQPQFNPLFLQGGVGLGKTHLMHAIAADIRSKAPERKVLYVSAEQFMYQFVRALRDRSAIEFKEMFRSVDVLMIDDVQFICGKDSTQEEFFHTFNALIEQNKQIILSADKSPTDLQSVGARLTSRMGSGLVAEIHSTTYELRLGILQARMIGQATPIDRDVLDFLAQSISSNVRELIGALNRLIAHAELTNLPMTLDRAQDILADLLRGANRQVTIEDIQRRVAEHYSIRLTDMHSPRRARAVARPRQVAMYLSKILTTKSLPDIGRKFGGRDHTTVMHAVKTIETLMLADPALGEDIHLLKRAVRNEA